ncbi:hypothetical protein KUTeg_007930 [Tegillarca granosa]|uniref:DZIP3-like HEPN domain-containing protein n=1 Tax=Tegillarca granosa TaxID=220873 RepID=A0ABQ9FJB6_TEGGR|nr:hypothetical protein KUTeg_007930 [Tegillarca granosa]
MASKLPTDSSETSYSSITLENSSEQISDINDHLIPHPDLETTKTLPQSTNDANKSDQQTPNNRQILNSASAVNTTPLNLDIQSVESLLQSPDDSLSPIHEQTTPTLQYDQSPLTTDIETKSSTNKLYRRLSSVEEISPEQTNFLRLALLIFNDGVRALRYLFDRYIPPCQLKCTLLNKKHEMRKLLQKGTISKEQWGNLYLQNKPSSKHFDITLMLVLIRQLTGIPEPANGWNELPQVSDNSIEADIARLKWYRNKIAHTVRCSVNNQEFEQMWTAISKAVIHVAGSDHEEYFENKIKNLTTAVLDKTYYEVYKELINTINQDNTHYFQEDSLKRWENDDKTFVPTRATEMIKSLVERHDFVMVTGPPGSGKSASVHSVALQFGKQGYRVFPVSNTNAIKDYWKKDLKQMFVVDDAFGYHTLNKPRCNQWKSDFNDLKVCFSHSDMKIVLTVRTTYEREPVVIDLLEVIKPMRIQINDKDRDLTVAERRNIFKAHVTFNNRNDLLEMAEQIQNIEIYCFPLLYKDGKKPLFLASEAGHFKIVQTLIDNGIMVSSSKNDYKGATPLYVASAGGHYDIVKLLLENGADNNRRASFGETPLIASSRKGYEDIVKLLIEKDADVNRCNRRCSRTPLFVATSEGQIRIVKMLIDKGADIDKLTNSTPLCVSIEKGHVEIAELLIENHADVNKCENKHGKSPLYIASEKGNPQLVRLLVDNGANLNQPDKDHNETPLHVAARYGNREICEILVRKGADVNIKNDRGETVRSILHKFGWGNIENILKE